MWAEFGAARTGSDASTTLVRPSRPHKTLVPIPAPNQTLAIYPTPLHFQSVPPHCPPVIFGMATGGSEYVIIGSRDGIDWEIAAYSDVKDLALRLTLCRSKVKNELGDV